MDPVGAGSEAMTEARQSVERERTVRGPAALVWAIAGDSNRWDRVVGAGRSTYRRQPVADGEGDEQVGHGTIIGMPATWLERGEWLEGELMLGERRYLSGPLALAGFRVEVWPVDEERCGVRFAGYLEPSQAVPEGFALALRGNLERAADEYLDAIVALLESADLPPRQPGEPAAAYGRRALHSLPLGKVLGGRTSQPRDDDLDFAIGRLRNSGIEPDHFARIVSFVRERPDYELEQVRPFELAHAWGARRRPLLRSFLHAATAGLFDLEWQINCPRCRVGADAAPHIADITPRSHCDVCDIDFDIDFAANVEAVFRANPAIRKVSDRRYCTSSPWFRPHVFAVIELAPGEVRTIEREEAQVGFVARSLRGSEVVEVEAGGVSLVFGGAGLRAEAGSAPRVIELRNDTDGRCTILLERREANQYATRGTDILTLPEFIDQYGAEAPASGADLSISSVTVLFSDLAQSTALYRALGDARAFALVHAHFGEMKELIAANGGATIKTMGDAIMASFASPGDATRAAIAMIDATRAHDTRDLALKVGIHTGPCVMVRANDRLDLFGTTVNLAWRLQEHAARHQLVLSKELLAHPGVANAMASRAAEVRHEQAELRGLGAGHALAVITLPA